MNTIVPPSISSSGRSAGHDELARPIRSGREARLARRRRSNASAAVSPGMAGGQYRPLSAHDLDRIHDAALSLLETVGMADPIPSTLARALEAGCFLNAEGRLCFPRALVEDMIAAAAHAFPIHARDPALDRMVGQDRVHFCTAGEAVKVIDFATGLHRPSTIVDLYDFNRLADCLEHIHHVGQMIVATDIADPLCHDLSIAFAGMAGTSKSFGFSTANASHLDRIVEMFDACLGRDGAFLARPFATIGHCPVVSPLRFGRDTSEVQVRCAELGLISDMCVAPQAGATAPAALAGALVQSVAETLAALIQVNLVRKGAPMLFGNWVFVSDLRTGAFAGGAGEGALLMAGAAQMARYYDLPGSIAAGMTDSKTTDYQAGYEKGLTVALAGLSGGNMVYEAAGMMSSLLATSFEAMVMDNDMIGAVQRNLRGIEVTDETLSLDVIADVTMGGPNHYLGHAQTLQLMESEFLYPSAANRMPLSEWQQMGSPTMVDAARERAKEVLSRHYPDFPGRERIDAIRRDFPIALPLDAMTPRPSGWPR